MKVAIVHDQLRDFGGAERVCVQLMKIFRGADLFTAFCDRDRLYSLYPIARSWNIYESWVSRIPFFKYLHSPLRFLAPFIWESFRLSSYDVVISSSGWYMSKGVITRPETFHASYVHHQPKYLYYYTTARDWQKHLPVRVYGHFINHFLRIWDYISSQRPDILVANSYETQARIKKFYRRSSIVIYPPVFIPQNVAVDAQYADGRTYYVTLSRIVKSKQIDFLLKVASKTGVNLKIVGTGRDSDDLKKIAPPNVEFTGYVSDKDLGELYRGARAYFFAGVDEEFGIAPVEAMSWGVPVIAYANGGLKETVRDGVNGYLFASLEENEMIRKIKKLEQLNDKEYIELCKNARKLSHAYSEEFFRKKITSLIQRKKGER